MVAFFVARRSRARRTAEWQERARAVSSHGLAVHDRIAAELAVAGAPRGVATVVWDEAIASFDPLAADVHELRLSAPDRTSRERALALGTALDHLRSIVLVERAASASGGAHAEGRSEADASLDARLREFQEEIHRFEAATFGRQAATRPAV